MYRIILSSLFVFLFTTNSFSQCSTTNLAYALPQSAAFASETGSYEDAWRAFDGGSDEEATHWAAPSGTETAYVGIDLGQQYNICSVYIEMGSLDYATSLKIQGSNDMTNWTDLISLTTNTQNDLNIDNLPTSGTYRYVRLLELQRVYSWSYYNVYEFQIFNRVANIPPNVDLTSPAVGASYVLGTPVNFSATASDLDGSVSSVGYYLYDSSNALAYTTTGPNYSASWTPTSAGTYLVQALATDNGGAQSWTDPVTITVTAPSSPPPSSGAGWTVNGTNINSANTGYVTIGTGSTYTPQDASIKLAVNGSIYSKNLTVTANGWADYVFGSLYRLPPLKSVASYIQQNRHLPDIPSAKEIENNGIDVGNNQALLLKKIEELTLYLIGQNDKIDEMRRTLQKQKMQIKHLSKSMQRTKA